MNKFKSIFWTGSVLFIGIPLLCISIFIGYTTYTPTISNEKDVIGKSDTVEKIVYKEKIVRDTLYVTKQVTCTKTHCDEISHHVTVSDSSESTP